MGLFFRWLLTAAPFTTALGCVHKVAPRPGATGKAHNRTIGASLDTGAYWVHFTTVVAPPRHPPHKTLIWLGARPRFRFAITPGANLGPDTH